MFVHWHPDNIIYVRNNDKSVVCYFEKTQLEQILNITLQNLPDGIKERQYYPGQFTLDFSSNTQFNGPISWNDGDVILSEVNLLLQEFNNNEE